MIKKLDPKHVARGRRLRAARIAAGYRSSRSAALDHGWAESTYRAHETGNRPIGDDDAERYTKAFRAKGVRVFPKDIVYGEDQEGEPTRPGRVSLDEVTQDWSDEAVNRAAEALKLLRP